MISSRTSTAVEYTRTDGDKRVLAKAVRENCTLIILTPVWPFQPWYTQLLRMSIQDPIFTPPSYIGICMYCVWNCYSFYNNYVCITIIT